MSAGLDVAVADHIATITITNPAKRNAMTSDMWRELPVILDRLAADRDVRVVVLTGADGTFCAGADIGNLDDLGGYEDGLATTAEHRLATFPKATIAKIEGYCVGGGCQLAVACDLRFTGEGARFGIPPAKLGIAYPASTTRRLVALVGPATAKYLLFSAELIDAARAERVGLVDEVVAGDGLSARVDGFARIVAARSQLTITAAKEFVAGADPARVEYWMRQVTEGGDAREGIAAFLDRRAPVFTWSPSPPE